jgi:uncharacterized cupredoxin-like copper-binding protein
MQLPNLALAPALILILGACSSAGSTASSGSSASTLPPASSSGAQRIEVKLTDALEMEPSEITVTAGQPVTFVVTNTGVIDHEFYLGDEQMQADQEAMMQSGSMVHDTAEGVSVKPGETKELAYTFAEPGDTFAGCHEAGHYAGGMRATITVIE